MNLPLALALFVVFGTLFGLATHSHRHLFSEGHSKRSAADERDPLQSRFAWTLLCSALWPLMALTGLFSWWVKRPR
jgi:Ca2+/H+ antiporter